MTTAELVKALAARLKLNQHDSRILLDGYIAAINRQLAQRNSVTLRNFASFSVKRVAEKRCFLPSLRTHCLLPAHHKLEFKAAKKLREIVNSEPDDEQSHG